METQEIVIQTQIETRKRLVMSAKQAAIQGFTREQWENAPAIKAAALAAGLPNSILEHISAFIWTFRR